jgi:hypothetical protein
MMPPVFPGVMVPLLSVFHPAAAIVLMMMRLHVSIVTTVVLCRRCDDRHAHNKDCHCEQYRDLS